MPRKGEKCAQRHPIGDPNNPDSLYHFMLRFLQWQAEHHYSAITTKNAENHLRRFITWCDERGLERPQDITKPIIERYQRYLFLYRKNDGNPMTANSQHAHLLPIRAWFKWLTQQNYLLYNPASEVALPKLPKQLPKNILTASEVEQVLSQPDIKTPIGIRDRAILETFYSTGLRRAELIDLLVYDINIDRGTLLIRQGKGNKDRMLPIGARALAWVQKYLDEVRPTLSTPYDDDVLFLTRYSERFTGSRLGQVVRHYIDAADIGKQGSCHLFRHTMATLMLENGADIRFIQAMLGHTKLNTTEVYTQVSIRKLKDIHTATHPAKMHRTARVEEQEDLTHSDLLATLTEESLLE